MKRRKLIAFDYDGMHFDDGSRVDLLVERRVVVEITSVERLLPVQPEPMLPDRRLLNPPAGSLINFRLRALK